jgi:hypothetical protein
MYYEADTYQEILTRLCSIEQKLDPRSQSSPRVGRQVVISPSLSNRCSRQAFWTKTLKGKDILLSEVEDEDDGQYILNEENVAVYTGDYGTHTFHANVCRH